MNAKIRNLQVGAIKTHPYVKTMSKSTDIVIKNGPVYVRIKSVKNFAKRLAIYVSQLQAKLWSRLKIT